jgi:hypothetical protein
VTFVPGVLDVTLVLVSGEIFTRVVVVEDVDAAVEVEAVAFTFLRGSAPPLAGAAFFATGFFFAGAFFAGAFLAAGFFLAGVFFATDFFFGVAIVLSLR